jgi:ligand-binding sensor domain-containing protein
MKYIAVLLFLFILCTSCGQDQTKIPKGNTKPSSANYSEAQLKEADTSKVPMSMVRNVKQARNGDVLIASYLGVFRYDGTSFTNLTSKIISPRFSSFWDVLEDRKGNLWFATKDSGAYYYNGKSLQQFTTREGLANNRIVKIYEDKAGNIWFATGGGVSRYDGKSFQNFTTKDGLSNNDLTTIMEDKTGKLWFGTRGEACFYDGEKFTVLKNKDGKAFKNVWSIIEDKKGNIWFSDVDGLWRYDSNTFTKISQKNAYAIIEDKKGNIWTTGTDEPPRIGQVWSLSRYNQKSLYNEIPTVTKIKSQSRMLSGVLEDVKGNIWFGSGDGVHRYDGKTVTDFKRAAGQK